MPNKKNKIKSIISKDEIFNLYKKVQQKDRGAEKKLIEIYRKVYPNSVLLNCSEPGSCSWSREALHIMYCHLYN